MARKLPPPEWRELELERAMEGKLPRNVQSELRRNVQWIQRAHGESSLAADANHLVIDIPDQSVVAIGNPPELWTSARCDRLHL